MNRNYLPTRGPHKKRWGLARTRLKTQTQPKVIVLVPQIVPDGTKLRHPIIINIGEGVEGYG